MGRFRLMAGTTAPDLPYRRDDGTMLIELRLNSVLQLFNSLDPAPFPDKDLDDEVERYIVGSIQDFPVSQPLRLVIHVPEAQDAATGDMVDAVHRYFAYRLGSARRNLRLLLRNGRLSLVIGIVFLFACISLRALILRLTAGTMAEILAEGLLISGWVAMWRPIEIFLYEWWPVRRLCQVYAKAADMPVEVMKVPAL